MSTIEERLREWAIETTSPYAQVMCLESANYIAELEKDRERLKVALEASYQMYHHTIRCPLCISALAVGDNLCDEHLRI